MKSLLTQNITKRFVILVAALVMLTAFVSQSFFGRQERTNLETRLREKASFVNNFYAFLIADALARKDDVTLLQVANRLEEDQEIFSVVVVDQRGTLRYHRDPEKVGRQTEDPSLAAALKTGEAVITNYENSGGRALALLTPLKVQGMKIPLGAVRIDLTHRNIEKQVTSSRRRFWFIILGSLLTCTAFISYFVQRWVIQPMERLKSAIATVNPAMPEPNLREAPDDMGKVETQLNDLLAKVRTEMQHQISTQGNRGEQEKMWALQLATTLLPNARVLIADKDNRVVADTANAAPKSPQSRAHLLDLIADSSFATLLTTAFQREGEPARGPVKLKDQTYDAMILSMPGSQAILVKTLIALIPNSK